MNDDLIETIKALRPGDEVEVTWEDDGHASTERGVLWEDRDSLCIGTGLGRVVRWDDGDPNDYVAAAHVITPAPLPDPESLALVLVTPFDSDEPILGITALIEAQKARYSEQSDPNYLLCRDCGGIVKHGWLSMHDGLHDAIKYPVYESTDEEAS